MERTNGISFEMAFFFVHNTSGFWVRRDSCRYAYTTFEQNRWPPVLAGLMYQSCSQNRTFRSKGMKWLYFSPALEVVNRSALFIRQRLLTIRFNSVEWIPSWEAESHSTEQEILRISWTLMARSCLHKNLSWCVVYKSNQSVPDDTTQSLRLYDLSKRQ